MWRLVAMPFLQGSEVLCGDRIGTAVGSGNSDPLIPEILDR
jgi:hypothetical protein